MSNLVTERDDEEPDLSNKEENKNSSGTAMYLYVRECFFLFALIFTSYAALFNSAPKIGKPPPPMPFFSAHSFVADYYKGTINLAFHKASKADLSIIMYYAPWDAESQNVRSEFEAAAELLHEEVYFTAISCWSPSTECKQHTSKIKHFPIIVAYPQNLKGVQYKGAIISTHLVHFLKTLMRPLHRIHSQSDIIHLIAKHDVVILGSFLFSGTLGGPGYYMFYSAAVKMLERDPYNDIVFAVTTDRRTAKAIGIDIVPSIRLYLWNETLEYPNDAQYTDDSLVKWVSQKIHQPIFWVSPPGVKSQMLSRFLLNGPALILFTPRNPLLSHHPVYSMVKEIALKYYNCKTRAWVEQLAKFIEINNAKLTESKNSIAKYCSKKRRRLEKERLESIISHTVVLTEPLLNRSDCETEKEDVCHVNDFNYLYVERQPKECKKNMKYSKVFYIGDENEFRHEDSTTPSRGDEKSPENLHKLWGYEKCKIWSFANKYQKPVFPKRSNNNSTAAVEGLACVNEKTLSIIALDSLLYYQFAEGLGINILKLKDKTAIAIVDKQEESQYILTKDITKYSVASFIANHTNRSLKRFLRSSRNASSRSITRFRYPVRKESECRHTDRESCVQELNSENFLSYVMDQTRAVIVFYHSPYCALCRSISHLFLLLSRYFRHFPGVQFVRIDGDNNDLPWEYSMNYFPTIIFFPTIRCTECQQVSIRTWFRKFSADDYTSGRPWRRLQFLDVIKSPVKSDPEFRVDTRIVVKPWVRDVYCKRTYSKFERKSESRIYSNDLPFTIRNLIHFTLANLEPEAKIPAMISLCISFEKLQSDDEARKCKSKVQLETYENLSKTLKHTRLTMLRWKDIHPSSNIWTELGKHQKMLIHKLDYFKTIHFLLGSLEKIRQNSNAVVDIIKLYHKFLLSVQNNSYYLNHDGLR